jgi:hypothetical protein
MEMASTSSPDEKINTNAKRFSDLEVGDILKNGEKVTAIIKFLAKGQAVYNIDGVSITGEHRLFHKKLGWIKAKQHPNRVFIPEFKEEFVYCLGTDTKTFMIGDQLYSDWDDIDPHVSMCLQTYSLKLPSNFSSSDIHRCLDNGISGDSLIELNDGSVVPIKNIQVNSILSGGEKVLGVIKIDARDLNKVNTYTYDNKSICGSNIEVYLGANEVGVGANANGVGANGVGANGVGANGVGANGVGAGANGVGAGANAVGASIIESNNDKHYLYQLLTDTGKFKVNGLTIHDYNYGIDKYIIY